MIDWKGENLLILDGGFATELERQGADLTGHLWSARLLRDNPSLIRSTHDLYYRAGADVGITSSYQGTFAGFAKIGIDHAESIALFRSSVQLAKEARDAVWTSMQEDKSANRRKPLVAASVGCYGASLADGSEYVGNYGLSVNELKDFHRERLLVLAAEKPDVLACETVPCLAECQAILELLTEPAVKDLGIPAWISVSCKDGSRLNSGETVESLAELIACKRPHLLVAVGVNCSSPHCVEGALQTLSSRVHIPLVVYANTGEDWDGDKHAWKEGTAVDDDTFCNLALRWREAGARIIGGCCRTTPQTISALRATLLPPPP